MYILGNVVAIPGFFCTKGQKIQCPVASICPENGMSSPIRCSSSPALNITCYHDNPSFAAGLTEPEPCESGGVCLVPYRPGVPAPPGYSVDPLDRTSLDACSPGDWCVLGKLFYKCPSPSSRRCTELISFFNSSLVPLA